MTIHINKKVTCDSLIKSINTCDNLNQAVILNSA